MISRAQIESAELRNSHSTNDQLDANFELVDELLDMAGEYLHLPYCSSFIVLLFGRTDSHDSEVATVLSSPAAGADQGTGVPRVRPAGRSRLSLYAHQVALTVISLKTKEKAQVRPPAGSQCSNPKLRTPLC